MSGRVNMTSTWRAVIAGQDDWQEGIWARSACEAAEQAAMLFDRPGLELAFTAEPVRVTVQEMGAGPDAPKSTYVVQGRIEAIYRAVEQVLDAAAAGGVAA